MRPSNSLDSESSAAEFNLVEQVIQHSTKIDFSISRFHEQAVTQG